MVLEFELDDEYEAFMSRKCPQTRNRISPLLQLRCSNDELEVDNRTYDKGDLETMKSRRPGLKSALR
jgi:hypothetical protein